MGDEVEAGNDIELSLKVFDVLLNFVVMPSLVLKGLALGRDIMLC